MLSKEDSNDTTPPEFVCPITKQMMSDPVLLPDGVSYERAAIEAHLGKKATSPKTSEPMSMADAVPNLVLKSLIERYLHPDGTATATATATTTTLPQELDISISAVYEGSNIHVQVKPNATEARPETIIVAVVDTSGSMDSNCAEKIDGAENVEISRLQLVQFSMKTIVNSLEPRDGLVLFKFEEKTKQELALTRMDETGKASATKAIDGLCTGGCTNVWDAVKVGAETAQALEQQYPAATIKVMVFTDGEPNMRPPQGERAMLQELLATMPARQFTLSTFSYGYSIDSALMDGLAEIGGGVYGYV
jgi:Mg-chelatase subunit ChlD